MSHSVLLAGLLYLMRFRFLLSKSQKHLIAKLDGYAPIFTFALFISSMSLATKFHLDSTTHNRKWSDNSGVSIQTINHYEGVILKVIDYKLALNKSAFEEWVRYLFDEQNLREYRKHPEPGLSGFQNYGKAVEGLQKIVEDYEHPDSQRCK